MKVLKMLEEGKISADDAGKLLKALDESRTGANQRPASPRLTLVAPQLSQQGRPGDARWFRVRVTDLRTGRQKVSVNIPVGLVNVGLKLGARFAPELDNTALNEIVAAVRAGQTGKIIEIADDQDGEKVEIFVE